MTFLKNKYMRVVTLLLLLQTFVYYGVAGRSELTPPVKPLTSFPTAVADFQTVREIPMEKEVQDVLKADDTLNREYRKSSSPISAWLFIAFFKTQRYGQAPHSPKNCLPGSGWEPIDTGEIAIRVPGRGEPIVINKYVVAHGDEKSVVLYWYQSHNRVIANEYSAKFWLVADSVRYRRSDTALIRIVVPVVNDSIASATQTGVEFVQDAFPEFAHQLSN